MTGGCPSPPCPVIDLGDVNLARCRTHVVEAGTLLRRVGSDAWPLDDLNPSRTRINRFSPLPDRAHAYVARKRTVALLESSFHNVAPDPASRVIYSAIDLAGQQLGGVAAAQRLRLLDLRDEQLARLAIGREQLVATSAAHYPCTRGRAERLAALRPGGQPIDGLLWHSRVAELAHEPSDLLADLLPGEASEVAVIYGQPGDRPLVARGRAVALLDGPGEWPPLVDQVAEQLGAVIM